MITERDLQEAIAECEGTKNPSVNTCIKLAAFYTVREHMFGKDNVPQYSYSSAPHPQTQPIGYSSDTEFSRAIHGMDADKVLEVMDELMTAIQTINPHLYAGVMRRIAG